jgi:hypothetical protein
MIEPVSAVMMLVGGYRLVASGEYMSSRRAAEREQRELVRCITSLRGGAEVGEVRADGSMWWIRIPDRACT